MAKITVRNRPQEAKDCLRIQAVKSTGTVDIADTFKKHFGPEHGVELDLARHRSKCTIPDCVK